ncbi:HpcH/HpaI aldolase family protein [Arthrobacter sp. P2b]|uniref:HpcH/HpaI aldolase family protein n=1 Tax=Arthrobacter sp. P2b TaxID=1938741 RepID=UPI0009A6DDC9|nr:aldolase/citrate lyase family protein [Arthrobacter sp. P2b]SLK10563.1 4-hydroxy-2-oxoheptanedioate aldolase [Arthrobacter sp. P2b]
MNPFLDRLSASPAFGGWIMLESALGAEHMGRSGYDFLVVDSQHGEVSSSRMLQLFQAAGAAGTPVISRVISPEPYLIMRSLDMGADGVIVPMISTMQQTAEAAAACRYAPDGTRSYGPVRPGAGGVEQANRRVMFMPMIETLEALDNLEEITAVDGVDALFIGPFDLGLLMGISPGEVPRDSQVLAAVERIVAVASKRNIPVGSVAAGEEHARALLERGVSFLSLGSDSTFVQQGATARLALAGRLRSQQSALMEGQVA